MVDAVLENEIADDVRRTDKKGRPRVNGAAFRLLQIGADRMQISIVVLVGFILPGH